MQRITSTIRDQRGFTLIEIIMVPKYIDLRTEAADATASGIVGAIVSSASIGYADLVTHNTASTFPNFTTLDASYLQAQNITLTSIAAEGVYWGMIGGVTYTFTYTAATGNAAWGK
jgi:hypothetical protein